MAFVQEKGGGGRNKEGVAEQTATPSLCVMTGERLAYGLDYRLEGVGVVECEVGQYFAIEVDIMLAELVHQSGIGDSMYAGTSVDTSDPEAAISTFLSTAVAECVGHTFVECIFRNGKYVTACAEEAASGFQHFFAPFSGGYRVH